jgi:hypothetical protein
VKDDHVKPLQTKPIVRITKNNLEELWLALDEWTDPTGVERDVINCRLFAKHRDSTRPTIKGWTLDVKQIPDLIAGLEKVRKEAVARGLLAK